MKVVLVLKKIIEKSIRKKEYKIKEKQIKIQKLSDWYWCIVSEKKHFRTPFIKRIEMYLNGFTSDQWHLYNLENNKKENYLTEVQRWSAREINGKYNIIFDDKRLFFEVFNKHVSIPKTIGFIINGQFQNYNEDTIQTIDELLKIIEKKGQLVFRRNSDGGGRGFFIVKKHMGKFYINNNQIDIEQLKQYLLTCNNYIISEYLNQLEYSNRIYQNSVNTIRVIVINNGDGTYSIPNAIHRFGCNESGVVDNACNGGIFSEVDVNTGVLAEAYSYYSKKYYEIHPNTKVQIKGIVIPNWNLIKESLLKTSAKFPYINLIAWDVVPTKEGFSVIEGNTSTDFGLLQAKHGIAQSELANFYKKFGI